MTAQDDTFPKLLLRNAARYGDRTALREKKLGIWHATSWSQYRDAVRDISLGLVGLGVGRGDKVAILGDNRPGWISAELAAQSAGADHIGVGSVYATSTKDVKVVGTARLAEIKKAVSVPVVAIGGIKRENVAEVVAAAADAVAVITAVIGAEDPAAAARDLVRTIEERR